MRPAGRPILLPAIGCQQCSGGKKSIQKLRQLILLLKNSFKLNQFLTVAQSLSSKHNRVPDRYSWGKIRERRDRKIDKRCLKSFIYVTGRICDLLCQGVPYPWMKSLPICHYDRFYTLYFGSDLYIIIKYPLGQFFPYLSIILHKSNSGAMIRPTQSHPAKSGSKSTSKDRLQLNLKDLQRIHAYPSNFTKPNNKTKSTSKCKSKSKCDSQHRHSKDSHKQHEDSRARPNERVLPKQSLFIQNRRRAAASQDKVQKSKNKKDRFFTRKNQLQKGDDRRSSSRKDSKRSTDNQNEETLIQRLKAENEYYKQAFLTSKESLQKLQKFLQEEKKKRNNEKEWFKYQISNLRRQLNTQKLQLGHIFSFESFRLQDISNMILETENQGSSILAPDRIEQIQVQNAQELNQLSIDSK